MVGSGSGAPAHKSEPGARHSSWPPLAPGVSRPAPREPTAFDLEFVAAMRDAQLMADIGLEELTRIVLGLEGRSGTARLLDILEHYYAAGGEAVQSARRVARDRFFLHRASDGGPASKLVERLGDLVPELGQVSLERIGDATGPLVLRAASHFGAIFDDEDDDDEVDSEPGAESETVTVRGVVRALNVLLKRAGVPERLIALRSDGMREAYVSARLTEATLLCRSGYLEPADLEELMDFAGW